MIKRYIILTSALLLPLTAHSAKSNDIAYDSLDIGWTASSYESDERGAFGNSDKENAGTFSIGGSVSATNNLAISGSVGVTVYDDASNGYYGNYGNYYYSYDNSTQTSFSIGLIPHFPLGNKVDLIIPLNLIYSDYEERGYSENDTGFSLGLGIRALVIPSLELGAQLTHTDIYSNDSQTFAASARWHISGLFSLALGVSNTDSTFYGKTTASNFSMRFSF